MLPALWCPEPALSDTASLGFCDGRRQGKCIVSAGASVSGSFKLLAFSVPASDSFICATGIKRTSRMSGMGEAAGDLVPLQEMQAL